MIWHKFPPIRFTVALVFGILLADFNNLNAKVSLAVFLVTSVLLCVFFVFQKSLPILWRRRGFAILIFLGLAFFGAYNYNQSFSKTVFSHFEKHPSTNGVFVLQLSEGPIEKLKSYQCVAKILAVNMEDQFEPLTGNILLYFPKDSGAKKLLTGQKLMVEGKLEEIGLPMNPNEFNYAKFLAYKGIFGQMFIKPNQWYVFSKNTRTGLKGLAINTQKKLMTNIDLWKVEKTVKDISKALLLGNKDEIDLELKQSFANTGASHILAVSGLHLGIVYAMATTLLFFLDRFKKGRLLKSVLILLLLWSFALITGWSPSVIRSALMFSFILIGDNLNRGSSPYNALITSAFLILLIEPNFLFDLGFQLSYLAVFFILWLYRPVMNIWQPKNWFLEKFWSITALSIAAQIGTFPLVVLYFHQFPNYFLITNWLLLPMISVVMYLGIFLLLFQGFSAPIDFLSKIYEVLVLGITKAIRNIELWPGSRIENIQISVWQCAMLYLLIILLWSWLFYGGKRKFKVMLCLSVTLVILPLNSKLENRKEELWVYHVPHYTVLGFHTKDQVYLITEAAFWEKAKLYEYHIKAHLQKRKKDTEIRLNARDDCQFPRIKMSKGLYQFGNIKIWEVDPSGNEWLFKNWLLTKSIAPPLNENSNIPVRVIINLKLSQKLKKKWLHWSHLNNVELIFTVETGAYKIPNF